MINIYPSLILPYIRGGDLVKVSINTIASGIDFLGWVHFTDHRVLRNTSKRRMLRNLESNPSEQSRQSYLGLLLHGNTYKIKEKLKVIENEEGIRG